MTSRLAFLAMGLTFAPSLPLLAESMPLIAADTAAVQGAPAAPSAVDAFASQSRQVLLTEAVLATVMPAPMLLAVGAAQPPVGSPVPEPSSLVLLATGALGVFEAQRRRRKNS